MVIDKQKIFKPAENSGNDKYFKMPTVYNFNFCLLTGGEIM